MKKSLIFLLILGLLFIGIAYSSCKAKSCDGVSNADNARSKSRVKHVGLFSKKEMRRKKW